MTMQIYSGITIIYIALIIVTIYAGVKNHKNGNLNILGMDFNKLFAVTAISTMIYCFVTALAMEYMEHIWNNFVFVLCVVGAIAFAALICCSIGKECDNSENLESIENSINVLNEKKLSISKNIAELMSIRDGSVIDSEKKKRVQEAIDELIAIREQYNENISELIVQKNLLEAKSSSEEISTLKLTSSKSVKNKLKSNIDKFDSVKELDDDLSDVRNIMKAYK